MLFDYDMLMNLSNIKNDSSDAALVNEKVGLQRGNLFKNEYKPYKNYEPSNISLENDLLLNLFETNFAIIDLNLYLDLNPNDNKMYEIYKKYVEKYDFLKTKYEQSYGPLEITCINSDTYNWIDNPWPWDNNGGNKYV